MTDDPIDLALLRESAGGDPREGSTLFVEFIHEARQAQRNLRAALSKRDLPAMRRGVHGLKDTAWAVAALPLIEACKPLEQALRIGDWAKIEGACERVHQVMEASIVCVGRLLKTLMQPRT